MNRNLLLLIGMVVAIVSCQKPPVEGDQPDDTVDKVQPVGNGFNFETAGLVNFSVTVSDLYNRPVALTRVEVYDQHPMVEGSSAWKDIEPIAVTQTNANGEFKLSTTLPKHLEKVYVVVNSIYYSGARAIELNAANITQRWHPAGYGANGAGAAAKALRANVGTAANATPWKYELPPFNASSNVWVLGDYKPKGGPLYLVGRDEFSSAFTAAIRNTLPERRNQPLANPDLFTSGLTGNLVTTATVEVWASFVSEGAWNNNSIGYYYYPTGSAPATAADIARRILIFPNVQDASGESGPYLGDLVVGDKVQLKYYDESTGQWVNEFPEGLTIGWFIVNKGYSTGNLTEGNKGLTTGNTYYSTPSLNTSGRQHNIIYFDRVSQLAVVGFEDIDVSSSNSDQDYNDVVLAITANPVDAINTDDLPPLVPESSTDTDGDGIIDTNDEYPNDPQRAFNRRYFGTLAYEDNWPKQGDYDFNDLVLGYNYTVVVNAFESVKDVKVKYTVRAIGANFRNGLAVQFGTGPGNVESVSGQRLDGNSSLFDLNPRGFENGQSRAVVPIFSDAHGLFGQPFSARGEFVNTVPGESYKTPVEVDLNVTFGVPVQQQSMGAIPYNVFLVANRDRGREVHLAGLAPTDKANTSLFGTEDDATNGTTIFYKNSSHFPWALHLPANFQYPKEYVNITRPYLHYREWAESQGTAFTDWHSNISAGYRNTSHLYE